MAYYRRPDEVRTVAGIAKGEMVLAPAAPLSNITTKSVQNALNLRKPDARLTHGAELFLIVPPKPAIKYAAYAPEGACLAPFWWVWASTTSLEHESNMKLAWTSKNNVFVPTLVNTTALKPNTKLLLYKPKAEVKPLANVCSVTSAEDDAPEKTRKRQNMT